MSLSLYMDVHVPKPITIGLRERGIDVLTAQEDGQDRTSDNDLLERADELDRVLFTQDDDLLKEAATRQAAGIPFRGVVYAHQLSITIGQAVRDLEMLAEVYEPEDMANRVEYLPY